jgi:hypothetical protein
MSEGEQVATTSAEPKAAVVEIKTTNRAIVKTLKDLQVKKARAEHHKTLVTKALNEGTIINGLRRDIKPQIPDIPVNLAIKWEEAHNTFTDTLTKLLSEYWSTKKDAIEAEITTALHHLSVNGSTTPEIEYITQIATEACSAEVTRLEAPKPQRQRNVKQAFKRQRTGATFTAAGSSRN